MNILSITILAGLILAITATPEWHQLTRGYTFEQYKGHFNKQYSHALEERQREIIFKTRLDTIVRHNSDLTRTWNMGVNQFTDRTPQELEQYLGLNKGMLYSKKALLSEPEPSTIDITQLPTHVDWRDKQVVTAVKDQGRCGSCWSFAASETLESMWAIKTGELHVLSEQNILDCTPNPNHCGGTGGCQGATVELAYDMIKDHGLSTEWTYPYISHSGNNFQCNRQPTVAKLTGYTVLPTNQLEPLMKAVAVDGPVAVSVDASQWFLYDSGVFDGCNQTNPDIDHAVQLVGYGTDAKFGDYWLVRNSWTPSWGEKGYIRLRRTAVPRCGIDISPQDGDGCDNGPPTVKVCGTCGILYDNVIPYYKQ